LPEKTKKESNRKGRKNSIALKVRRNNNHHWYKPGGTKIHNPRGWETSSLHWFTPGREKETTLDLERLGGPVPGGG
jgi:hypothetical protein